MGIAEICFSGLMLNDTKIVLAAISLLVAVASFCVIKYTSLSTKARLGMIYTHVSSLLFPAVLFTTHVACNNMNMACSQGIGRVVLYSVTATFILTGVAGFFVIPSLYNLLYRRNKITKGHALSFIKNHVQTFSLQMPNMYLLDTAKPIAFSFNAVTSSIFISIGMLDILSRKEAEAVLLHELGHIKNRSSALKVSTLLLQLSPFNILTHFTSHGIEKEERDADMFAIAVQKTQRYIRSAKRKVGLYTILEERFRV